MNWINYLLQINLYLILTFGFYWLLLRKETFYTANRFYLLAASILSFAIPFWQSGLIQSWAVTEQVSTAVAVIPLQEFTISNLTNKPTWDWNLLMASIYFFGFGFGLLRFSIGLFKLQQLFNLRNLEGQAFSVFGKIFVDKNLDDYQTIKNHEEVHSKEYHSLDVFWFELIGVICWFNPIAHFMQKEIKLVHEYVADQYAAELLGSKKSYAQILVGSHFKADGNVLVNNFHNKSILKTRIMMLSKEKSKKSAVVKYGLIAPLFLGMFIFAVACTESSTSIQEVTQKETTSTGIANEIVVTALKKAEETNEEIFETVEHIAEYPGGSSEMYKYISANILYPKTAIDAGISGKVFVKFVIDKEGSMRNPKVRKGIGYGTEEVVFRLLEHMPKWKPAIQNGELVSSYFMPFDFQLD